MSSLKDLVSSGMNCKHASESVTKHGASGIVHEQPEKNWSTNNTSPQLSPQALHIGGLPSKLSSSLLYQIFSRYGSIETISLHKASNRKAGFFAIVVTSSTNTAAHLLSLSGQLRIEGAVVRIQRVDTEKLAKMTQPVSPPFVRNTASAVQQSLAAQSPQLGRGGEVLRSSGQQATLNMSPQLLAGKLGCGMRAGNGKENGRPSSSIATAAAIAAVTAAAAAAATPSPPPKANPPTRRKVPVLHVSPLNRSQATDMSDQSKRKIPFIPDRAALRMCDNELQPWPLYKPSNANRFMPSFASPLSLNKNQPVKYAGQGAETGTAAPVTVIRHSTPAGPLPSAELPHAGVKASQRRRISGQQQSESPPEEQYLCNSSSKESQQINGDTLVSLNLNDLDVNSGIWRNRGSPASPPVLNDSSPHQFVLNEFRDEDFYSCRSWGVSAKQFAGQRAISASPTTAARNFSVHPAAAAAAAEDNKVDPNPHLGKGEIVPQTGCGQEEPVNVPDAFSDATTATWGVPRTPGSDHYRAIMAAAGLKLGDDAGCSSGSGRQALCEEFTNTYPEHKLDRCHASASESASGWSDFETKAGQNTNTRREPLPLPLSSHSPGAHSRSTTRLPRARIIVIKAPSTVDGERIYPLVEQHGTIVEWDEVQKGSNLKIYATMSSPEEAYLSLVQLKDSLSTIPQASASLG